MPSAPHPPLPPAAQVPPLHSPNGYLYSCGTEALYVKSAFLNTARDRVTLVAAAPAAGAAAYTLQFPWPGQQSYALSQTNPQMTGAAFRADCLPAAPGHRGPRVQDAGAAPLKARPMQRQAAAAEVCFSSFFVFFAGNGFVGLPPLLAVLRQADGGCSWSGEYYRQISGFLSFLFLSLRLLRFFLGRAAISPRPQGCLRTAINRRSSPPPPPL